MIIETRRPQSVYVASDGSGRHKIGVTADAAVREYHLSRDAGTKATIRHLTPPTPRGQIIEATAHWLLAEMRSQGEWFDVSEAAALAAVEEAIRLVDAGHVPDRRLCVGGRPVLYPDKLRSEFCEGTLARIQAVLTEGENQVGFIREAVERELARRKG